MRQRDVRIEQHCQALHHCCQRIWCHSVPARISGATYRVSVISDSPDCDIACSATSHQSLFLRLSATPALDGALLDGATSRSQILKQFLSSTCTGGAMASWPDVPYQPEPRPGPVAAVSTESAGQPAQAAASNGHLELRITSSGDTKVTQFCAVRACPDSACRCAPSGLTMLCRCTWWQQCCAQLALRRCSTSQARAQPCL